MRVRKMQYIDSETAERIDSVLDAPTGKVLFRFFDSSLDYYDDGMVLRTFKVVRETALGVWIDNDGKEKFVRSKGKNLWAFQTVEQALNNYFHRKRRQIVLLERQLANAKHRKYQAEMRIQNNSPAKTITHRLEADTLYDALADEF